MIELRPAQLSDGRDIYDMITEIGPGENGYVNAGYDMGYSDFPGFIRERIHMAEGLDLPAHHVPQTTYWLLVDSRPVGIGKLRHSLNEHLIRSGGHIGYAIRPGERGKGYGKLILGELIKAARQKGITVLLLTCDERNIPSRKVIEAHSGRLVQAENGKCAYHITT
ncbi:GNAT family N-acetyltransferase [Paenibacillus sp. MMS20-IR301]|uniref:GNAT family N-acetyltransferase n=1 Tax=Paenibacillus sp. MMS20-IR301 TaxID=2895946 RepID=UPI0028ED6A01|nr:GNAT family N-acetyltransferase [Paenibacillus sp. MMS20-IR301]WNS42482.1 GNAT family N-acetyltransferase [Paenibacillus sp. MMS20-IR301]